MLKKRKPKTLSLILLFVGLLLIIPPIIFYINQTIQLKFVTPNVPTIMKSAPNPLFISIPAINLNLPIEETAIQNKTWQISSKGISHLVISANPTEKGPIILYGHNTNDRFGPIRWLTTGKEILITTADNKIHKYVIVKTTDVDPKQTTIFFSRKDETLYLYTCDGFADLQRFVVIAVPGT